MATWQNFVSDNFTRPDTSFGSAAFSSSGPGNNWIDQAGNAYRISNNQLLSTVPTVGSRQNAFQLMRPTVENRLNQKIIIRTGTTLVTNNSFWLLVRADGANGAISSNFYALQWASGGGAATIYKIIAGVATVITTQAFTFVAGQDWEISLSAEGSSPTTLTLSLQNITAGTAAITKTVTDSTAGLQVAGRYGIVADYNTTNTPNRVASVTTQYDNAVSMVATSGGLGNLSTLLGQQTINIAGSGTNFNGGANPAFTLSGQTLSNITVNSATSASVVVTPGTTPQSLVLTDNNTGALAYIPLLVPSISLSPAAIVAGTSGNIVTVTGIGTNFSGSPFTASSGVTINSQAVNSPTSATLTITGGELGAIVTITDTGSTASALLSVNLTAQVNDPKVFFSPYNWFISGNSFAKTVNPGAYLKTIFTGTTISIGVDVSMLVAAAVTAGNYPTLRYSIDNAPWVDRRLLSTDSVVVLSNSLSQGTHTLLLYFNAAGTADRWTTPVQAVTITGVTANGNFTAPSIRSKRAIIFWDSIGEGVTGIVTGNTAYASAVESSIPGIGVALNSEIGAVAFSGHGYARATGNVPMLYNSATPSASSWDKYFNGQSRLLSGKLNPVPDYIICVMGTNDGLAALTDSTVTITVSGWLRAVRAAAPTAKIFVVQPIGRYKVSAIAAGFNAYQAGTPDGSCFLIDLGTDIGAGMTAAVPGGTHTAIDGTHPRVPQNSIIGAAISSAISSIVVSGSGSASGGFSAGNTYMLELTKQPSEKYPIAFEFYGRLPFNTTLVSGVITARNLTDDLDATSVILQSTVVIISGTQVRVGVQGGTHGKTYVITLKVTLSDGSILEDEVRIKVAET